MIDTPHGPARAHLRRVKDPRAALVLGHGAGGGVAAGDLVAAAEAALSQRVCVALVEQAYRVAARRSPAPAKQLDAVWLAVIGYLRGHQFGRLPLITGGRSAGARVACRTARECGAAGVLCLAFPLRAPRRASAASGDSRLPELDQVAVPTLVVQGARDPFGVPPAGADRVVIEVLGDHSLRTDGGGVRNAVSGWLAGILSGADSRL